MERAGGDSDPLPGQQPLRPAVARRRAGPRHVRPPTGALWHEGVPQRGRRQDLGRGWRDRAGATTVWTTTWATRAPCSCRTGRSSPRTTGTGRTKCATSGPTAGGWTEPSAETADSDCGSREHGADTGPGVPGHRPCRDLRCLRPRSRACGELRGRVGMRRFLRRLSPFGRDRSGGDPDRGSPSRAG